ncbi:phosphotransferase [Engelhardtia mirabilis]|uniref:Phosphotransferase enzyme family protein n=1 Tax=Engelhardtia mirabilis TaxID=2528011 RepID=A0A518BDL6_9BACT|nr:Phosphotransferase enzyme family protein [Planctomycetes bacterium Pla133]QDU99405.1 Phosphotransferase enzyme family protein [Planctomycetes bacterium Pla86]
MTSQLTTALDWIGRYLSISDVSQRVRRADLDRKDRLMIELDGPEGGAWFRVTAAVLRELAPADERELPLAAWYTSATEDTRLVSWRPGRRMVVELPREGGSEFWKGLRPKRLAEAARRHDLAQALCDGAEGGFAIPALLGVDCDRSALKLTGVVGFEPRVRVSDESDFEQIGRALRRLQDGQERLSKPLADLLPTHTAEDELAVLAERGRRCVIALGQQPQGYSKTLERLRNVAPRPTVPVPCHRDLHDGQVLLGTGAPTLMDLDLLCLADPLLDVANLLAHLALRRLQGLAEATPDGVRACGDALLTGLDRDVLPDYLPRLRFYQATALLRLSALYALRPRWQALTADLIRLAERCTDEVVPASA